MSRNMRLQINLLGDSMVGKTSIINSYMGQKFQPNLVQTVGITKVIKVVRKGEKAFELELCDTNGQERYNSLCECYLRNTNGVIIVFDVRNRESFAAIPRWIKILNDIASNRVDVVLVGNKIDNDPKSPREVSKEEAEKFAAEYSLNYYESSAKESYNICRIFDDLTEVVLENYKPVDTPIYKVQQGNHGQKCCE